MRINWLEWTNESRVSAGEIILDNIKLIIRLSLSEIMESINNTEKSGVRWSLDLLSHMIGWSQRPQTDKTTDEEEEEEVFNRLLILHRFLNYLICKISQKIHSFVEEETYIYNNFITNIDRKKLSVTENR